MIKKDRFNTERFVANHSLEEIRKQFKKDKDHQ